MSTISSTSLVESTHSGDFFFGTRYFLAIVSFFCVPFSVQLSRHHPSPPACTPDAPVQWYPKAIHHSMKKARGGLGLIRRHNSPVATGVVSSETVYIRGIASFRRGSSKITSYLGITRKTLTRCDCRYPPFSIMRQCTMWVIVYVLGGSPARLIGCTKNKHQCTWYIWYFMA